MGYMDEKLWNLLEVKVLEEDENLIHEHRIGNEYLLAVKDICEYGVQRAKTIRDTFPMFTLHDETHICNVMRLMWDLLGEDHKNLTRDETALLIMTACCHDIGMSFSEKEKQELFQDSDRLNQYLDNHHGEYVKAYSADSTTPVMTDDMIQNYFRCIHHERVMDLLFQIEWPGILVGKVDRESLIWVCQSHGNDIGFLDEMEATATVDLRFCAVLLRLADILDFDTSRAPEAVYQYSRFQDGNSPLAVRTKEEWDKHLSSYGFDFLHIHQRSPMYSLDYHAKCRSMQIEQTVNVYLDWVDEELLNCGKQLRRFVGRWQSFILPGKLNRKIISEGYVSGQYRLTLDQEKIIDLLVGDDLYSESSVFVRELIQNAIDAVRTREQLDKNLPSGWKGQINIRCWRDDEGYHWFRIEDNGIGMTEEMIMNYFLKIGSSYYTSDSFFKSKIKSGADPNYIPISRFGIGILSCFMGDKLTNQVEVSTKHFKENDTYYPALRLRMYGINGYYYLANRDKKHMPGPMKGVTQKEKEPYLMQAGTVIAVRTNLYQTSKYRSFKDIVDQYVVYPPVAIHYDGEEGAFDYLTETEFMDWAHGIQPLDSLEDKATIIFPIPNEVLEKIYQENPEIHLKQNPKLLLKILPLDYYTSMPYLKGVLLTVKAEWEHEPTRFKFGEREMEAKTIVEVFENERDEKLGIKIRWDFGREFKYRMRQIDTYCSVGKELWLNILKKIGVSNTGDFDKYEVFDEIMHMTDAELDLKEYIISRYGIKEENVNDNMEEIESFVWRYRYQCSHTDGDIETIRLFSEKSREWVYEVCLLSEFNWYSKYFKRLKKYSRRQNVIAHNGILCGNDNPFEGGVFSEIIVWSTILLKDKYRPYLDIARNTMKKLPLEPNSEIEIIKKIIFRQGFIPDVINMGLIKKDCLYITMNDYCKLLKERGDLADKLLFDTIEGVLSSKDIAGKLSEGKIIKYLDKKIVFGLKMYEKFYKNLCIAFLRDHYTLQIDSLENFSELLILKKEYELSDDYKKLFPPSLFLPMRNKETGHLTTKGSWHRVACNEHHRLSKFIIQNGNKLNKYVPGIFKELLLTLSNDDGDSLIENVNNLLKYLKLLPESLFEIPDELFLTDKDLC